MQNVSYRQQYDVLQDDLQLVDRYLPDMWEFSSPSDVGAVFPICY